VVPQAQSLAIARDDLLHVLKEGMNEVTVIVAITIIVTAIMTVVATKPSKWD
jgi:hypothetical protein